MSEGFVIILLVVLILAGLLSLVHHNLFISVILLAVFSFTSALLFYVAHAPDVAITEAAVGAGMTTLIFVWAVRTGSGGQPEGGLNRNRPFIIVRPRPGDVGNLVLVLLSGLVLLWLLPDPSGGSVFLRDFIFSHGYDDTGALNLVSAVYLGYRAFDTFGETIVLLSAVSASIYLLGEKDAH